MLSIELWGKKTGSLAFPCKSFSPEMEHQKPGGCAKARGCSTILLALYGFFLMTKYFYYYESSKETQNLISQNVGLYWSEI